jgi:hypothetical protein
VSRKNLSIPFEIKPLLEFECLINMLNPPVCSVVIFARADGVISNLTIFV